MSQTLDLTDYVNTRKLSAFNIRLIALSFVVVLIDGFDITVAAFAVPELIKAWKVPPAAFGQVLAASMFGILFGALIFGFLGDRYGRKMAIVISYVTFGLFTLLAAWSTSVDELKILRFLAGIGIGGLLPNIVALNAEFAPRRLQATAVIVSFTGVAFGGALPAPVAAFLMPHYGWPILFMFGGIVPLIAAVVIAIWLPESIRFFALKDRRADVARLVRQMDPGKDVSADTRFVVSEEKRLPFKYLFSGELALMTPLLWLLFALNLMAYYFLVSWMPTLLGSVNIPAGQAALVTMVLQIGGVIGSWSIAWPMDKRGMLPITILFVLSIPIVGAIGYVSRQSPVALFAIVFFAGFCTLGIQMGINAVSAILYPTALRATGSGWAFGVGRIGSIIGPIVGGILIGWKLPIEQLYMYAAIPFVFGAIASFILMRLYRTRMQNETVRG